MRGCWCRLRRPTSSFPARVFSRKVHETPAEFAAQIKKNILAQLTKWEIDRAALQALAASAGDKAADAAKVRCSTAGSVVKLSSCWSSAMNSAVLKY